MKKMTFALCFCNRGFMPGELIYGARDDMVKAVTAAEKALAGAIKTMLGINPAVHLVAPKTIARSEGKAVRVKDKRKLHD